MHNFLFLNSGCLMAFYIKICLIKKFNPWVVLAPQINTPLSACHHLIRYQTSPDKFWTTYFRKTNNTHLSPPKARPLNRLEAHDLRLLNTNRIFIGSLTVSPRLVWPLLVGWKIQHHATFWTSDAEAAECIVQRDENLYAKGDSLLGLSLSLGF